LLGWWGRVGLGGGCWKSGLVATLGLALLVHVHRHLEVYRCPVRTFCGVQRGVDAPLRRPCDSHEGRIALPGLRNFCRDCLSFSALAKAWDLS